jgi:hypothetical protein
MCFETEVIRGILQIPTNEASPRKKMDKGVAALTAQYVEHVDDLTVDRCHTSCTPPDLRVSVKTDCTKLLRWYLRSLARQRPERIITITDALVLSVLAASDRLLTF